MLEMLAFLHLQLEPLWVAELLLIIACVVVQREGEEEEEGGKMIWKKKYINRITTFAIVFSLPT